MQDSYYYSIILNTISIVCNTGLVAINKNNPTIRVALYWNIIVSIIHLLATLAEVKIMREIEIGFIIVSMYFFGMLIVYVYKRQKEYNNKLINKIANSGRRNG